MQMKKTDNKSYEKQFFSGVAVLALSTFIVKIIGLFYKIPMMAYLGAEGMGYFNSAYEIYSLFFVIATTGIPVAISILVSENKEQGRINNIKKIFKISIITLGGIGLIATLLMGVCHKQFATLISNDAASLSILAISPTVFLVCISSAIRGYFQGNQVMIPTAVSQVIEALGKLILGLGFAIIAINNGYSMPIVAAFAVLGLTVGTLISLLYLVLYKFLYRTKETNEIEQFVHVETNSSIIKQLLTIAIPITLSSTILSLTKIIDMTMILGRLSAIGYSQDSANAIFGSYSTMAVSIYNLPSTLVTAIALPLVPMLTAAIESYDKTRERSVISSSLKLTALVAFPAGLGISVFSKPILRLLFSSQVDEIEYTAPLLSLLGMSIFLSSMITVTNAILQAYKQVNKPIISMICGIVLKLILSYVLIGVPDINIYGAPISTFFSTVIIVAINLYFIIRNSGNIGSISKMFIKPFVASFLAVVLGVAAYLMTSVILDSKIAIILTILLVVLIYLIAIIKLKVIENEEILMLPGGKIIIKIFKKIHLV
jgi:stage V sporulation protein B